MRTETAPADAPFGADDLARNFQEIVFRYEFHFDADGGVVRQPIAKPLKRWRGRIGYRMIGDAVLPEDRATVRQFLSELEILTGLTFRAVEQDADLLISIASPEGQGAISAYLASTGEKVYRDRYATWRRDAGWVCGATLSSDAGDPNRLVRAHIFLRAAATGLRRTACLHEEIAQSLGLTNDSPQARPSIFNDDQEFALLTKHDEALLRALYDRRLRPGMRAEDVQGLLPALFREILDQTPMNGGNP